MTKLDNYANSPICEFFSVFDDVIVVFVVVTIVVQLPLLFPMLPTLIPVLGGCCSSLLLGVVDLVDVLVRLDQIHAQLP